jgi:hypothetical protein
VTIVSGCMMVERKIWHTQMSGGKRPMISSSVHSL